MARNTLITAGILLALVVGVPAARWEWVRVQAPTDLAFESVEVRRVETGASGDHKIFHYDNALIVRFRSKVDLQTFARDHGIHLHFVASPCAGNSVDMTKQLFDIYKGSPADDFGEVDVWAIDEATDKYRTRPSGPRDPSGTIGYYFMTYLELTSSILPELYHYDLARNPTQICAVLEGHTDIAGEFYLPAFTSNVIIVPSRSVADAVSRAHLQ